MTHPTTRIEDLDLRAAVERLTSGFRSLRSVHLFGSRRYATGSLRSDIDLLLRFDEDPPAAWDLAPTARRASVYLDPFIAVAGVATSAINASSIQAESFEALVNRLDAVQLWASDAGWT